MLCFLNGALGAIFQTLKFCLIPLPGYKVFMAEHKFGAGFWPPEESGHLLKSEEGE